MKVSIIIPVYNQEKLLKKAVDSIPLNKDLEVLIIDDGSTDGTYELMKQLSKHPKIKIFHFETNQGVANARNIGLDNAQGEYIFMLDSDDWLYTDNFIKALNYLNGDYDLVHYGLLTNTGKILMSKPKKSLVGQTKFIKRSFIGDLRYESGRRLSEDYFFHQDLMEKHPKEFFTKLIVFHYNFPREGSLSWQKKHRQK